MFEMNLDDLKRCAEVTAFNPDSEAEEFLARGALWLLAEIDRLRADDRINRVEVIDGSGRGYVRYTTAEAVTVARQDDGRTLKVFIKEAPSV